MEITSRIYALGTGRRVIVSFVPAIVFAIWLFNFGTYPALMEVANPPLLEERFGYDATEISEFTAALGTEGRLTYQQFQWADTLNALLIFTAFTFTLAWSLGRLLRPGHRLRLLVWLPALALASEVLENTLLCLLAGAVPDVPGGLPEAASLATRIKLVLGFTTFPLALLSLLAAGLQATWQRLRGGRS